LNTFTSAGTAHRTVVPVAGVDVGAVDSSVGAAPASDVLIVSDPQTNGAGPPMTVTVA
jgi:hypothetical protein